MYLWSALPVQKFSLQFKGHFRHEARCPRFLPLAFFSSPSCSFLVSSQPGGPSNAQIGYVANQNESLALRKPGTGPSQDLSLSFPLLAKSNLHTSAALTGVMGVTVPSGATVGARSGGASGGVLPNSSAPDMARGSSVVAAATSSSSPEPCKQNQHEASHHLAHDAMHTQPPASVLVTVISTALAQFQKTLSYLQLPLPPTRSQKHRLLNPLLKFASPLSPSP